MTRIQVSWLYKSQTSVADPEHQLQILTPLHLHKSLVSSSTSQLPLLEPVNNTETKSWVSRYSRCPEALWKSQRIKCVCSQYKSCLIDISLHSNFGKFCRCRDRTQLLRFFKKCISSILTNGPVLCLLHPLE